jgi:hypothetical protein
MPTADTFDCKPMGDFVRKYLQGVSVDPFARNKRWATHTNDLNPETDAEHHMDAVDFLRMLADQGVQADVVIVDPPYSPRQVKECYDGIGMKMQQEDALRGLFLRRLKEQIVRLVPHGGMVLTFGWNSTGMGGGLGFEPVEILLVCHGSDHNDTICVAERRAVEQMELAA